MLLIAEVADDLPVQRGLDHPLGQLLQQTAVADQLQARRAGLLDQPADQLSSVSTPSGIAAGVFFFATAKYPRRLS